MLEVIIVMSVLGWLEKRSKMKFSKTESWGRSHFCAKTCLKPFEIDVESCLRKSCITPTGRNDYTICNILEALGIVDKEKKKYQRRIFVEDPIESTENNLEFAFSFY